ncbi:MAG: hypothetical protein QME14_01285 [Methanobacteriaceae archaeon]|nr:hypothetical protein [Methanobacteriaceae archaeon]
MINLIITIFGALLIVAGIYAMTFGFDTPPNFLFFFAGLCIAVLGFMLLIIFGSNVDISQLKMPKTTKASAKPAEKVKSKSPKSAERLKEVIQAKEKAKKKEAPPIKKDKVKEKVKAMEKKPVKEVAPVQKKVPKPEKKPVKPVPKPVKSEVKEKPKKKPLIDLSRLKRSKKPEETDKPEEKPSQKEDIPTKAEDKPSPKIVKPVKAEDKPVSNEVQAEKSKITPKKMKPITPVPKSPDKDDEHYVKERLDKLKQNYIENVADVEDLIEERLESFRGTLNKIKAESKEPNIIWSFDAADVQDAMKETILQAENKIVMMYPWVRNIDVGILKKFMDTDSKMIIQEASLDDDASVELIKVLQENKVQIRTMPHVHTVAVVSDNTNGLIISTDPIYESFEVGVIYKDENSISEIEKLFNEAWDLSKDVVLEDLN